MNPFLSVLKENHCDKLVFTSCRVIFVPLFYMSESISENYLFPMEYPLNKNTKTWKTIGKNSSVKVVNNKNL